MPLALIVAASAAASTDSSKSMVPTTLDLIAGSATKGSASSLPSAQPYRACADFEHRSTHHSSPPEESIHSIWSTSSRRVAIAGVLYVWSLPEFSSATDSERNAGF